MGGVWERQIRTIRSVLNVILHQSGGRLESASLRTFLYEAMAIVNGRPMTIDNLGDPTSLEPLVVIHSMYVETPLEGAWVDDSQGANTHVYQQALNTKPIQLPSRVTNTSWWQR